MNDFSRTLRGPITRALAVLFVFSPAGLLAADTPSVEVQSKPAEQATSAEVRIVDGAVHLSLDETVALALEHNLGLRVDRFTREQGKLGIEQAMGIYDLNLTAAAGKSHSESPAASNLEGAEVQKQDQEQLNLGLSQLFASGGTGTVAWNNNKFETNNQFFVLNPSYNSGFDLSFSQPLLRGFGRQVTEFNIQVARLQDDISRKAFVEQVVATVQTAENAYWNLVAARSDLQVAEQSLELAKQLHEDNKVRVKVGTLAPLELVSSEAGIASREEGIIQARAAVGDAEDVVRYLLDIADEKVWPLPVIPDTDPAIPPSAPDLHQSLAQALDSRPELAREKVAQQSREIQAAYYTSQTKPRLDLTASYGYNGVGGEAIVRDPDGTVISRTPGGWSDAIDQIGRRDFPVWSVGLNFAYPLQNRAAKTRATIAGLAAEQGKAGLDQLRQQVEAEVRIAVRGLATAQQQIDSARASVTLYEKNVDAEKKKYENGLSTSYQILQVEDDLSSARSRLVAAITGYRKAMVEYHRSIGDLLGATGVTISE
jgi:outer membrane protein